MIKFGPSASIFAILMISAPGIGSGQDFTVSEDQIIHNQADFSPFVDQHHPDRVLWGDTHLHTSNSPDAGMVGNSLPPDAAYRFAKVGR